MLAQETGFLPATWEIWIEFLNPEPGLGLTPAAAYIWEGQWIYSVYPFISLLMK